jgi:DNA-binding NtrC family response regulator
LLLDEIGDMPLELQAKLLRVLEERTVTPVGSDRSLPVDVRVIAATHRDLQKESAAGRFRRDLYMRLAQLAIELPPLRARREDILMLLQHGSATAARLLTPELVHALLVHAWPGNVRETLAVANQLQVEGVTDELLQRLDPPESVAPAPLSAPAPSLTTAGPPTPPARPYRLPKPEKAELQRLLQRHLGTIKLVAQEMGCSRRHVQRLMEQYDLQADDFRNAPAK